MIVVLTEISIEATSLNHNVIVSFLLVFLFLIRILILE